MKSARTTLVCVLWSCLVLCNFSYGCDFPTQTGVRNVMQDGISEPRGRHRLQLLFPLLLRISTRLATLVPTALMGLVGIIMFVIFSKKALIISLFALFISLSGKYKTQKDDIYIHKVDSYSDYNDEEHIYYHGQGPSKHTKHYSGSYHPVKNWKQTYKRKISSDGTKTIPLYDVAPFKPLSNLQKRINFRKEDTSSSLFEEVDKNSIYSKEEYFRK